MTFISLVAALLLEQLRPLRSGNRIYGAFARYVDWLARNLNAGQYRDGVIAWLLAMAQKAPCALEGWSGANDRYAAFSRLAGMSAPLYGTASGR